MAKACVTCTCNECGKTFEKSTTKHNRTEANKWEEWAKDNYVQCSSCWGKEQRKKEESEPLTINVSLNPYNIKFPVILWFSGNTITKKEEIKAHGYYWRDQPITGTFGILSMTSKMNWNKMVSLDMLESELKNATDIGAQIVNKITDVDILAYQQIKKSHDEKENKLSEKIKLIDKPVCPAILSGKTWNTTIYGKKGSYCFYSNNVKISITDEQKNDIEKYLIAKEKYKKAISEIE